MLTLARHFRRLSKPIRALTVVVIAGSFSSAHGESQLDRDPLGLNDVDIGSVFDLTTQEANPVELRRAMRNVAADWFERQIPYYRVDRSAGLLGAPNPMAPRWDFDFNISFEGNDFRFRVSDGAFRFSPHRLDVSEPDKAEAFVGVRLIW